MITNRIKALEIEKRGLYTLVYGHTSDMFIGDDLKKYNFDQQLYLYFKSKGFSIVIFYDQDTLFYSFNYDELNAFVSLNIKAQNNRKKPIFSLYKSNLGPLKGKVKISQPLDVEEVIPPTVDQMGEKNLVYWKAVRPDVTKCYEYFLKEKESDVSIALVIKSPNDAVLGPTKTVTPWAQKALSWHNKKNKLIIISDKNRKEDLIIDYQNHRDPDSTFFTSFFQGHFFKANPDPHSNPDLTDNCFMIDYPDEVEIKNLLHHKRLTQNAVINLSTLDGIVEQVRRKKIIGQILLDFDALEIKKIQEQANVGLDTWLELNNMTGLKGVKDTIKNLINSIEYDQERIKRGLITNDSLTKRMFYVFTGNPGTGKTTVARLFGKMLKELRLLQSGHLIETKRQDLVAEHVGGTAPLTRAKIEEALDGVLFIDEAYSLTNKGEKDFGPEAVETLLAAMTDPRYEGQMAVIVAGYPEEMSQFLNFNPGLLGRFTKFIHFEDYSSDELLTIFEKTLSKEENLVLSLGAKEKALVYFESIPRDRAFSNVRKSNDLIQEAKGNITTRLKKPDFKHATNEELSTITAEDIPEPLHHTAYDSTNLAPTASLADEILPRYQKNNESHIFIRQVCDEIQEVLIQILSAYNGEESFEVPLRSLENEEFKKRVESLVNYSTEINYILYDEIKTGMEAFRLFFRGILCINQNEIENAVDYFKRSLPLAKSVGIDELERTSMFLSKYWEAIISIQDGDLKSIQSRLKDIQNDIELSGVSEHYKQLSDLMQADIFFVSALKSLSENDIEQFFEFIDYAACSIDKVVVEIYANTTNNVDTSGVLLKGVSNFYRAFGNLLLLFRKVDEKNFNFTRELSSLSVYTQQAILYFNSAEIDNNARMLNLFNAVKSFLIFESFLKELSIIMIEHQQYGKPPEEKSLTFLKSLSQQAKESLKLIDDTSLNPLVEMCENLTTYANEIGNHDDQKPIVDNLGGMFSKYQGFANQVTSEQIDIVCDNIMMLKQHSMELIRKAKAEDVFKVFESNKHLIKDEKVWGDFSILSYRYQANRLKRFRQGIISHDNATTEENLIIDALIHFIRELKD